VSTANIGQLSVDILLSNVDASKVSAMHDVALIPCVAADPLDLGSDDLMTACQGNPALAVLFTFSLEAIQIIRDTLK